MVLPLIPAAVIAVGAAVGGGGLALGGKGAYDIKKASGNIKEARAEYEKHRMNTEQKISGTNQTIGDLGTLQQRAYKETVLRMAEFMVRNQRKIRESERLLVDGVDAKMARVPGLTGLSVDAKSWVGGAAASAVSAMGTGAAATAAVTSFGAASTGTAIAGLSGAAAQSATIAWLGGGALAAGGGGMAVGAVVLNVLMIGPALLVGGFVTKGQGVKAITQAKEFQAKIAVGIAELAATDAKLAAVDDRAEELSSLLQKLTARAVSALDLLESEPFEPQAHAPRFQRTMVLVVAVRDLAATPVIDDSGDLSEESSNLTIKYRAMTEEAEDD
ncbi:hypothetical protein [Tomitella biformata]|uniref:hypothetical protein n=1 Tax=Tomitella biformata TaxID=630403 RepID=UPI0004655225|nr:hypothetical protein [Tomitella biformata]